MIARNKIAVYRRMLDKAGINYVDAATLVLEARHKYPISVFPRGGTHWNMLAASIAAQAVTDKLNSMREDPLLTPFTFTAERSFYPQGSARDLMEILNLVWPDTHYEVPVMSYNAKPPAICQPTRLTEIGGSFLFEMDDVLAQSPARPRSATGSIGTSSISGIPAEPPNHCR